jgi:molecular chaperone GrpE
MKIMGGSNQMPENKEALDAAKKEIEDLKKQVEEKEMKVEEQKNQMLRLMADFDNFKKRAASEREDIIWFSNEALILALLPILDNFDRAMKHTDSCKTMDEDILKGFALIKRQLEDILTKIGLAPVEALGKAFDPNIHEAVLTRESKDKEDGTVIEEMQKGYKLRDKVIRPSMVIVAKK